MEWWWGFGAYDRVYMSKVFDTTYPRNPGTARCPGEIVKGGTGCNLDNQLPDEVEHMMPDYSSTLN